MQEVFNHIGAKVGEIADVVLMCGDPNRATIMAEKFLTDANLVSSLRGNKVYTGYFGDRRVTIMASFMGNASMGIYSYELYDIFGVKCIIRLGTAGSLDKDMPLGRLFVATRSITDSNYDLMHEDGKDTTLDASIDLVNLATDTAKDLDIPILQGDMYSKDSFYMSSTLRDKITHTCAKCLEMESGALYRNAAKFGRQALAICTVTDNILTGERMPVIDRENKTQDMFRLALEMAKKL